MSKKEEIQKFIEKIEKKRNIRIIYAVENGSRVWGMESKDSDYDVRGFFVHPTDKYLQLDKPFETLEEKEGDVEAALHDIYKFCSLLRKSNPVAIEWLESSIVYKNMINGFGELKKEYRANFNPLALYYHYRSLCMQNYEKYIKSGADVRYKRYLYCLRGAFNALYVEQEKKVPPIILVDCVNSLKIPEDIKKRYIDVIRVKKLGFELEKAEKITVFDKFIEKFLKKECRLKPRKGEMSIEFFNKWIKKNLWKG